MEKVQNGSELVVRVKNSVWANELILLVQGWLKALLVPAATSPASLGLTEN